MFQFEEKVKLFNDDCFNILPTIKSNSINLILVDLPYIISRKNGFDRGGAWNNAEDKRKRKNLP